MNDKRGFELLVKFIHTGAMNRMIGAGQDGWAGEPGELILASETSSAHRDKREWVTQEEAAARFNIAPREIRERYEKDLLRIFPDAIIDPITEVRYEYDFEAPGIDWEEYAKKQRRWFVRNQPNEVLATYTSGWELTTDPYHRRMDCYPEMKKGFVPDEDEDGDALMLIGDVPPPRDGKKKKKKDERRYDLAKDYDQGLEGTMTVVVLQPKLYNMKALKALRDRRARARRDRELPPRGAGGRFVKKTE